jgi:hypothetical protein
MNLQRRLRDEQHARAALDTDPLLERITPEHSRSAPRENDVRIRPRLERAADAERWLGVRVGQDGPAAPVREDELETSPTPDRGSRAGVSGNRVIG